MPFLLEYSFDIQVNLSAKSLIKTTSRAVRFKHQNHNKIITLFGEYSGGRLPKKQAKASPNVGRIDIDSVDFPRGVCVGVTAFAALDPSPDVASLLGDKCPASGGIKPFCPRPLNFCDGQSIQHRVRQNAGVRASRGRDTDLGNLPDISDLSRSNLHGHPAWKTRC